MRLAVLSDLHLGKKQYRTEEGSLNKYESANYRALFNSVELIKQKNPDIVLLAGDIFDTPNPSVYAMEQFRKMMRELVDYPMLLVLGNHDFGFVNKANGCSAVRTLLDPSMNIKAFAEYEPMLVEVNDTAFLLAPYIYDKLENLTNYWQKCLELLEKTRCQYKVCLTHGVTENYALKHSELADKFQTPTDIVRTCDVVLIGHIHTPFEYMDKNTLVISPGSVVDYQAYENHTGPLFVDVKTKEHNWEIIDTPHIIKRTLDETNINTFLSNVGAYIYNLTYDGDIDKIDNDLFVKAKNKAINLVLNLSKPTEIETKQVSLNTNFYDWVKSTHEDMLPFFIEAKNNLSSEEAN